MTTYRIEIQATADGDIWQTVHTETVDMSNPPAGTVHTDGTALDLAEAVAENQDVVDGGGWRVRVYIDCDDVHVAEAGPAVAGLGLTEITNRMHGLASLPPVVRAQEAATLAVEIKSTMARIRRAAVYEATRTASWADVARDLGISTSAVNQLVTQHLR